MDCPLCPLNVPVPCPLNVDILPIHSLHLIYGIVQWIVHCVLYMFLSYLSNPFLSGHIHRMLLWFLSYQYIPTYILLEYNDSVLGQALILHDIYIYIPMVNHKSSMQLKTIILICSSLHDSQTQSHKSNRSFFGSGCSPTVLLSPFGGVSVAALLVDTGPVPEVFSCLLWSTLNVRVNIFLLSTMIPYNSVSNTFYIIQKRYTIFLFQ